MVKSTSGGVSRTWQRNSIRSLSRASLPVSERLLWAVTTGTDPGLSASRGVARIRLEWTGGRWVRTLTTNTRWGQHRYYSTTHKICTKCDLSPRAWELTSTSCLAKLFNKTPCKKLDLRLKQNEHWSPYLNNFKADYRTVDTLFIIKHLSI